MYRPSVAAKGASPDSRNRKGFCSLTPFQRKKGVHLYTKVDASNRAAQGSDLILCYCVTIVAAPDPQISILKQAQTMVVSCSNAHRMRHDFRWNPDSSRRPAVSTLAQAIFTGCHHSSVDKSDERKMMSRFDLCHMVHHFDGALTSRSSLLICYHGAWISVPERIQVAVVHEDKAKPIAIRGRN